LMQMLYNFAPFEFRTVSANAVNAFLSNADACPKP
jgi:hypothetical protein